MKLLSKAANLVAKQLDNLPSSGRAAPSAGAAHHHHGGFPRKHDPVLEQLLRDFRSATLRAHFFAHAPEEYLDVLDVKLLAGTYNVAGKRPPPGLKLDEWLDQWKHCWPRGAQPGAAAAGDGSDAAGPDLVAIGFQEVVPLSAGNVIAGPTSDGADAWDYALAATLNGDAWAAKNAGRTFGSQASSQAAGLNLGSQAAYAAYSLVAGQAASVVGAMDKLWSGANGDAGAASEAAAQSAEQAAARLAMALGDSEDGEHVYVQVASKQLVGLYLSVWARKRLARSIRGVQATSAATGWGGYLGNKGAVAVRMRVHDAPLLLVCCHLASGDADGDEARRNADAADILRRCVFAPGGGPQQPGQPGGGANSSSGHWGGVSAITDHDNVVWLGDLNYRLACGDEEARRYLRAGKLEALLVYDQLTREMAAGRVFQGWQEGPITFQPTYKYHLGCNVYSGEPLPQGLAAVRAVDSSASLADSDAATDGDSGSAAGRDSPSVEKQKRRTPAWCDRVLWLPDRQLYQLAYGRGELAVSDHRPVAAAFLLQAHRYRREAVQQLAEAARRAVDMSDNASRPRCTLTPNFVELGSVPFGTPRRFSVTLANVGPCPARFYFVAPPRPCERGADGVVTWDTSQPLAPPWLRIEPTEGEVPPDGSASIELTALITGGGPSSAAAFLAAAPPPPGGVEPHALDAILILRLEDGADAFISLRGSHLPSCFGADLDLLLTLGDAPVLAPEGLAPDGRAALQAGLAPPPGAGVGLGQALGELGLGDGAQPGGSGGGSGEAARRRSSSSGLDTRVPKEVRRLLHFLEEPHRLRTPGLFVLSCQAAAAAAGCGGSDGAGPSLQQLLDATAPVRWALDTGLDLPAHVGAHEAAAALLLLLGQLPDGLMPPDVHAILLHCVPPAPACSSLLSDAMSVAEWATLRRVVGLCRAALGPDAAAVNGLTVVSLAGALAEHWFGTAAAVPAPLVANRIAFIMTLLDPEGAASGAQLQPQQEHAGQQQPAGQQQQQHSVVRGDPAAPGVAPPTAPANQRGTSSVAAGVGPPQESLT